MKYRFDPDLEFLSSVPSENLDILVRTLTHDKDDKPRISEQLTKSTKYKRHYPNHAEYWEEVAGELQRYGSNTLVTLIRGGKGVEYKEILCDVCDKLKVNYNKKSSVTIIEQNLVIKIIEDAFQKMTPEEVREIAEEIGFNNVSALTKDAALAAFIAAFRAGGFKSYQIMFIVINTTLKALIGRGLPFAWAAVVAKTTKVLVGPIGWVITGVWTAFDIASPAYRVTIPAVMQIAALRQKAMFDAAETNESSEKKA